MKIHQMAVLVSLAALALQGAIAAQLRQSFLLDETTLSLLQEELSGERAKDHVIAITRYHRIQGSRGYVDAARYVLQQFHSFGFTENKAWIESFPSDGRITYQTWQSPPGWSIESAELRMIEPHNELIVRYPDIAMSVITYSNPGHVQAELVDVGVGISDEDYQEKDVKGKLVLASGYGGTVHRLAVLKYGAAAVVCYLDDQRAAEHSDMLQNTGMWPRTDELDQVTFGFNLTPRQGQKLKEFLNRGTRVVLDAKVNGAGLEFGSLDVVVALIPGSERPEQELIYTAHLDHPKESANDNASGSAAILDIARSLKGLINEGKLPPPRRTLRFLWVPEFFGTMAYMEAHPELKGPELGGSVLANLNLDMVGENLELLHSRMNITWTPQSISSALTDVAARMAEYVDTIEIRTPRGSLSNFNYRITPFSGGSDHVVFNDGMIRIPAVMLGHWPDYTHHTSEDTTDKVDPIELERSELIAAGTFWYLANLSEEQSLELANLVAAKAQERMASDMQRAASWLLEAPVDRLEEMYNEGKRVITFALEREQQALNSILYFASFESTRRLVQTWNQTLENQSQAKIRTLQVLVRQRGGKLSFSQELTDVEREAARWIPWRLTRGPLANGLPQLRLPEEEQAWYETPEARALDTYLLVNFIDGRRSILDIRNVLCAATQPVPVEVVDHFIQDLAKVRLIELREAE
ncbi:MAG: DUF4910 domain-containing protein [Acidobacteriota bacterium]